MIVAAAMNGREGSDSWIFVSCCGPLIGIFIDYVRCTIGLHRPCRRRAMWGTGEDKRGAE